MRASPTDNPFKGLEPYGEKDPLFGRDGDLVVMRDRLFAARTTLLFAGAGTGKTSFLNARLVPELRRRYGEHYVVKMHAEWTSQDPHSAVRAILGLSERARLSDFADPQDRQLILILDQFEELFQSHIAPAALDELRGALGDLLASSKAHVVLSLREDFLGSMSALDREIPDLFRNYHRLRAPGPDQARDIIEKTCAPISVDPRGLDRLLLGLMDAGAETSNGTGAARSAAASDGSIVLPYLQIVCQRLWTAEVNNQSGNGAPTFLRDFGARTDGDAGAVKEVRGLLAVHINTQLEDLKGAKRRMAARTVDYLVTSQGAKMPYELDSLTRHMVGPTSSLAALVLWSLGWRKEALVSALEKMTAARILKETTRGRGRWFELYHDMYAPALFAWRNEHDRKERRSVVGAWILMAAIFVAVMALVLHFDRRNATRKEEAAKHAAHIATIDSRAGWRELNELTGEALLHRLRLLKIDDTPARRMDAAYLAAQLGDRLATFRPEGKNVAVHFEASGKLLATVLKLPADAGAEGGGEAKSKSVIQLWSTVTGRVEGPPIAVPGSIDDIQIDPHRVRALANTLGRQTDLFAEWRIADGGEIRRRDIQELGRCKLVGTGDTALLLCSKGRAFGSEPTRTLVVPASGSSPLVTRAGMDEVVPDPSGRLVAAVYAKKVELLDARTLRPIGRPLSRAPGKAPIVEFSGDGRRLALNGPGRQIRVLDSASGKPIADLTLPETGDWTELALDEGGGELLVARRQGTSYDPDPSRRSKVEIWRRRLVADEWDPAWVVPFQPFSSYPRLGPSTSLVGVHRGLVRANHRWSWIDDVVWDAARQSPVLLPGSPWIRGARLRSDGIAFVGSEPGAFWLSQTSFDAAPAPGWPVRGIRATSMRSIVWRDAEGSVQVVDLGLGKSREVKEAKDAQLVAVSRDGAAFAAVQSGRLVSWRADEAGSPRVLEVLSESDRPGRLGFSEDGRRVVLTSGSAGPRKVSVVDPISGKVECQLPMTLDAGYSLSPDGRLVATLPSSGRVHVHDCVKNTRLAEITSTKPLAFSPDGSKLLAASENGTRLWSSSGALLGEQTHENAARAATFSPDGMWAAFFVGRREVVFWHVKSDKRTRLTLEVNLQALRFAPDSRHLLLGGERWLHLLTLEASDDVGIGRVGSRASNATWSGEVEFLDPAGKRVRVVVGVLDSFARRVDLDFEDSKTKPLEGDPQVLLDAWAKKLALSVAGDEIIPIAMGAELRADSGGGR